jgi:hypothetical protein
MSAKAEAAWAALNDRQRLYLRTIYDFDQAAESEITRRSAERVKTPPASEWRQITYDVKLPREVHGYSSVQSALRQAGKHDRGSGSSLAALRRRGLVEVTHDTVYVWPFGHVPRVRVRLTTTGRAAARAGAGAAAPARASRGLMARWSFLALARLYAAGQAGLSLDASAGRGQRAPSWNTLLNLRDRRDGSLIEEFNVQTRLPGINPHTGHAYGPRTDYRVRLSPAGHRHYEVHHACYRELHPDVDAPGPAGAVESPHAGLADHRASRRRRLVRDTDLRLLAELVRLEADNACFLRRMATEEYERRGLAVPAEVRAIPPGLLRWQVKELTRTEKSIDRLAGHPGGPLVETTDVPNSPLHRDTRPTLPLVVLTQAGRDHYARHLDEYRRAYPDLNLP